MSNAANASNLRQDQDLRQDLRQAQALQRVLVTVIGRDTPGITAALSAVISENHARLLDIEQVVVQNQLTLCMLIGLSPGLGKGEPVLKDLLFTATSMGLELRFDVLGTETNSALSLSLPLPSSKEEADRYAVTAIGDALEAEGIHVLAKVLETVGANIVTIRRLSSSSLSTVEVIA